MNKLEKQQLMAQMTKFMEPHDTPINFTISQSHLSSIAHKPTAQAGRNQPSDGTDSRRAGGNQEHQDAQMK